MARADRFTPIAPGKVGASTDASSFASCHPPSPSGRRTGIVTRTCLRTHEARRATCWAGLDGMAAGSYFLAGAFLAGAFFTSFADFTILASSPFNSLYGPRGPIIMNIEMVPCPVSNM